jgi:hypothetical protein
VIYLTSSRGAVATAIAGVLFFVLLTPRRWLALGTLIVTGTASGIAVAVVERHPDVANGVAGSSAVAIVLLAVAVAAAVVFAALLSLRAPGERPPAGVGWGVAATLVLAVALAVLLAHPVRRLDEFKKPPTALAVEHGDYVKAHLLSGSGSGRWQFWQAAVDEFRGNPLHGRGAGSYGEWWAAHGSLATSVQDAHSLYLETLGELGITGLVLLLLPFAAAAALLVPRVRRSLPAERVPLAGAAALVGAYLVAAGVDWMWELTAVSLVAFAALAVVVAGENDATPARRPRPSRRATTLGAATVLTAWLAACAAALPLLTQVEIGASQDDARNGLTLSALQTAKAAVALQPWAASPHLQLALVTEQAGRLEDAEKTIRRATARAPGDWHLWLVAARIQAKRGEVAAARRSLRRARSLNPRSPLFAAGAPP